MLCRTPNRFKIRVLRRTQVSSLKKTKQLKRLLLAAWVSTFLTQPCGIALFLQRGGGHIVTGGKKNHTHTHTSWLPPLLLSLSLSPVPATNQASVIQQIFMCTDLAASSKTPQLKFTGCLHCKPPFQEGRDLFLQTDVSCFPATKEIRNLNRTGITQTCPNCDLSCRITAENKREDSKKL